VLAQFERHPRCHVFATSERGSAGEVCINIIKSHHNNGIAARLLILERFAGKDFGQQIADDCVGCSLSLGLGRIQSQAGS